MKRKEKRQRKKLLLTLILVSSAVILGLSAAFAFMFYPHFLDLISGEKEVMSAFVAKPSLEDVKNSLKKSKVKFDTIEFVDEGETYKIVLTGGEVIKLSSSKDIDLQVSTLQKLLRRLTIDNKQAKQIDLRYTRPVVKF